MQKIEKDPDNVDLQFSRAILYGVVLNYTSAITEYDQIIANDKKGQLGLFPYFNRAYIRYKMVEMMQTFNEEELPDNLASKPLSASVKNEPKKDDGVIVANAGLPYD